MNGGFWNRLCIYQMGLTRTTVSLVSVPKSSEVQIINIWATRRGRCYLSLQHIWIGDRVRFVVYRLLDCRLNQADSTYFFERPDLKKLNMYFCVGQQIQHINRPISMLTERSKGPESKNEGAHAANRLPVEQAWSHPTVFGQASSSVRLYSRHRVGTS